MHYMSSTKNKITQFKSVHTLEEITDNLSKIYGINPLPFVDYAYMILSDVIVLI